MHFRVTLSDLQQLPRCARWLAASLFPLLQIRLETPRAAANCVCDKPLFIRTRTTWDLASTFVRLLPPALISFKASRTSCHTSRSASNLANALPLSFLTIFKYLQQLLEDVRRNVLALCFCIQGQHPKLIRSITNKIDDPESYTPLAYSQQRNNGCPAGTALLIRRNGRDDWIRTSDLTHPKRAGCLNVTN